MIWDRDRINGSMGHSFNDPPPPRRVQDCIGGSVSRIPAADIEDIIVKSRNKHFISQKEKPSSNSTQVGDRKVVLEQVARVAGGLRLYREGVEPSGSQ